MLLDTNAYTALANKNAAIVKLVSSISTISIPLPVIAELRYGFLKGSKAEENEQNLQKLLAQPQVLVCVPTMQTTQHYAKLQLLCQQKGRALAHNDLWIGALAIETGDTLVTYDKDFSALQTIMGDKLIILQA